jgi:two-component system CheB/CheR fusion protein
MRHGFGVDMETSQRPKSRKEQSTEPVSETALFPVVAVGASAGGLEAFTQLLHGLPDNVGMAFVFIQHLDPTHHSMLAELLSKSSSLPVVEAKNRAELRPNCVYVIPPNVRMGILQNRLQLTPREQEHGLHLPIDFFMRSLAEERKDKAVGAVLSGTGSDGTLGLAAIKAEGGITFAQEAQSAKYDGMPRSAIASGCVDSVLTAEDIAKELVRIARHPYFGAAKAAVEKQPAKDTIHEKVYSLLRKTSGIDFRLYKPGTVRRRTLRRMAVHKIERVEDYVKHLQAHPEEVEQLYQDLLIPVTSFFRDPDAFETLKSTVFPAILKDKSNRGNIRIWTPGCSTGEETYSVAIALLEFLGARAPSFHIQLFGTDANERGIDKARSGIYLEQIAQDISLERLRRFFVKVEQGYRVSKAVRDLCVFARQNIAEDPPFSQMNLVSCRNLLIYFGSGLQQRVVPILHYALRSSGFLMLGNSESTAAFPNLFAPVDNKHKIFAKRVAATRLHYDFSTLQHPREGRTPYVPAQQASGAVSKSAATLQQEADRIVLKNHAPAGLVINGEMEILQFRGRTSAYVEPAPGRASLNLLKMARRGLTEELRKVINKALKKGSARVMDVPFQHNGRSKSVNIFVERLNGDLPAEAANYLVLFEEIGSESPSVSRATRTSRSSTRSTEKDRKFLELQRRAANTEEHLRSVIESKEALEEEFQSANEEILSANEELQSSNEELETSKEELQSTNEELTTVNDELRNRNLELGQLNNDLSNLLSSTTLPVVMVDRGLRIRRATSASAKAFKILPSDIGRPITDIRSEITIQDIDKLISGVIETLATKEVEVQDRNGHWYSLQIRPYRTADDKIDGAVLVLNDIDLTKSASERFKRAKEFSEGIIDTVREPLLVLDSDLRVAYANPAFFVQFRVSREETARKFLYRLGNEQWNIPKLRALLEKVATDDTPVSDYEVTHDFPDLGTKTMLLNARRIHDAHRDEALILLAIEDVTERRQAEKARARLAAVVESSTDAIITKDLNGTIETWNAGAEHLFGFSAEEAVGRSITLIIPPELQNEEIETLARLRRGELIEHFDTVHITKKGKRVPVSLTISPIKTSSGEVVGASKVARDITDRKRTEDALKQSHDNLEVQVQRRTESLRQLSSSLHHMQDDERRKIARELHDSVGQYLVSVKMNLAQADHGDVQKSKTALSESNELLDRCIAEIRTISHLLHPPLLDESGLASAAKWYVEGFGERSSIEASLDVSPHFERLPQAVEMALFRTLQESLTNVHRHSGSSKVDIRIELQDGQVGLIVRDYGKGVSSEKLESFHATGGSLGVGLTGMRERILELGGNLQIVSESPGISVRATIPIGNEHVDKTRPFKSPDENGSAA